jgi:hypothetical protein
MVFCPHCGKTLQNATLYCPHCGKPIPHDIFKTIPPPTAEIPEIVEPIHKIDTPTRSETKKQWIKGIDNKFIIIGAVFGVLLIGFFSQLAPPSKKPATFTVTSLTASRYEIPVNRQFTFSITAEIANSGDEDGVYTIAVKTGQQDAPSTIKTVSINITAHSTKVWTDGGYYSEKIGTSTIWIGEKKITVTTYPYISAFQIVSDYNQNEIAADQKYKGQIFYVYGNLYSIGKALFLDTPFITIEGGALFSSVQCSFPKSANDQIAALTKGDFVIVKGKCSGKILLNPYMDECVFFKP